MSSSFKILVIQLQSNGLNYTDVELSGLNSAGNPEDKHIVDYVVVQTEPPNPAARGGG